MSFFYIWDESIETYVYGCIDEIYMCIYALFDIYIYIYIYTHTHFKAEDVVDRHWLISVFIETELAANRANMK